MQVFFVLCMVACAIAMPSGEEGNKYEGDIILTPDQLMAVEEQDSKKKNGNQFAAIRSNHWKTNGVNDVIKYYIESSLVSEERALQAISDAIATYHQKTCIRFQRVYTKPTSSPHLSFFKGSGCWSYVGKMSSGQQISLSYGCWRKGTVIHEMGHALGFFHEQSRPDRDDFVKIVTENIKPANLHNFDKHKTDRVDSRGHPYDYRSIMHYGSSYFAKTSGAITIETKDPSKQSLIGQRADFSDGDVQQFNDMYNCHGATARPVTDEPKPRTQAPTLKPRTTATTGVCTDKKSDSTCQGWKIICDTNSYVQQNCAKTCGLCTEQCVDEKSDSTCQGWKIICDSNTYVQENCAKTCGLC